MPSGAGVVDQARQLIRHGYRPRVLSPRRVLRVKPQVRFRTTLAASKGQPWRLSQVRCGPWPNRSCCPRPDESMMLSPRRGLNPSIAHSRFRTEIQRQTARNRGRRNRRRLHFAGSLKLVEEIGEMNYPAFRAVAVLLVLIVVVLSGCASTSPPQPTARPFENLRQLVVVASGDTTFAVAEHSAEPG